MPDGTLDPGFLTGRIVDGAGTPVRGARILEWPEFPRGEELVETVTDSDGRFRLGPLGPRLQATLFFESPAHARERIEDVPIHPGADHDLGNLILVPGAIVRGRIVDEDNQPLRDVSVTVEGYYYELPATVRPWGPSWAVRSGVDGAFLTPRLPVGSIDLKFRLAGKGLATRWVHVAPGIASHDLGTVRLEKEVPVAGAVTDDTGRPVSGAIVCVVGDSASKCTSDADGNFELRGHGGQPIEITIRAPGFRKASNYLRNLSQPVKAGLQRGAEVRGRVVEAGSGRPVVPGLVSLMQIRRGYTMVVENGSEILEDGRFRVWYVDPDEYEIAAAADGYQPGTVYLGPVDDVTDIDHVVVELNKLGGPQARERVAAVVGRVIDLPPGVASGWASLWGKTSVLERTLGQCSLRRGVPVESVFMAESAPVRADGTFQIDSAWPGECWLRVDFPGHAPGLHGPVELAAGRETRLDLSLRAGGSVRGRVATASLAPNLLWVVAFGAGVFQAETRVRRDGSFVFERLPPGRYGFRVGHDGLVFEERMARARRDRHDGLREELCNVWRGVHPVEVMTGCVADAGELVFAT